MRLDEVANIFKYFQGNQTKRIQFVLLASNWDNWVKLQGSSLEGNEFSNNYVLKVLLPYP